MFPPQWSDFQSDRVSLKGDLPWEPWLHPAIWFATMAVLAFGDGVVYPPFDNLDFLWVSFGLASPVLGFSSVWMLHFGDGRRRYQAIWLRAVSGIGLVTGTLIYYFEYIYRTNSSNVYRPFIFPSVVVFFCLWYLLVLIFRDAKLIVKIEKLASALHNSDEADKAELAAEIVFKADDAS